MSNASTASTSTTEENLAESSVENITEQILAEASESYRNNQSDSENTLREEEQIIREMDRDLPSTSSGENSLRRRRAASEIVGKEEDKILIKLKYINDEIKTVSGYITESIGNFKR